MKDDGGNKKRINRHHWLITEVAALKKAPIARRLHFAERLTKEKETLIDSLDVLASYYRDLLIYKYSPELISNRHFKNRISESSADFSADQLLKALGDIQAAQKKIDANAGPRLTLEVLVSRLARV